METREGGCKNDSYLENPDIKIEIKEEYEECCKDSSYSENEYLKTDVKEECAEYKFTNHLDATNQLSTEIKIEDFKIESGNENSDAVKWRTLLKLALLEKRDNVNIQDAQVEEAEYKEGSHRESLTAIFSDSGSGYHLPSRTDGEALNLERRINETGERQHELNNEEINEIAGEAKGRQKRGRKRKYKDQSRADRKKKCNHNEEYINTKGQTVVPKQFLEDFQCMCAKKCTEIVDVPDRKKLFTQFWTIGTFAGRCAMINMCVKEIPKKRCYTKNVNSRRKITRKYYCGDTEICKITFLKTLQINQKRIDIALKKCGNEFMVDLRGLKRGGLNKVKKVINHMT
ncbi:uncharacterized protein [Diabrotica undecimpunctata]|uniref:uncharacterized protein n=1 Tax=Diabrotica undecimpunctata TaxID=50387 RepID=UPI003B639108